jgi:hypothetical protein
MQQNKRRGGNASKHDKQDIKINEESKNLIELLVPRLKAAHQVVDELVQVYKTYGAEYDRVVAYNEEIDIQQKEDNEKNQKKTTKKQMDTTAQG